MFKGPVIYILCAQRRQLWYSRRSGTSSVESLLRPIVARLILVTELEITVRKNKVDAAVVLDGHVSEARKEDEAT